jgi:hypothetical protein
MKSKILLSLVSASVILSSCCKDVTANFTYSPSSSNSAGESIVFTDQSAADGLFNSGPSSWIWDFGDGSSGNGSSVTHSYSSPGTYNVSLTTKCKKEADIATKSIKIEPAKGALLFWVNAFYASTPCGNLTVTLNNGAQSYIYNYYNGFPASCVNLCGGYFYVEEGIYTYQAVTVGGCHFSGTVKVIGNRCNLLQIQ